MSSDRPTLRPVTIARLVEAVYLCSGQSSSTPELAERLDVTDRRANEVIAEARRLNFIEKQDDEDFATTQVGTAFITTVENEDWAQTSDWLVQQSPHYRLFLHILTEHGTADKQALLNCLQNVHTSEYTFNQTTVDVLTDWAERLEAVQRNVFSGTFYRPTSLPTESEFEATVLDAYERLEQRDGTGRRQLFVSIPRLREQTCELLHCRRSRFDKGLIQFVEENIGDVELSGAPIDTAAKQGITGIKGIQTITEEGLVTTEQSTERVLDGVEQQGKKHYYFAVHSDSLLD